MRYVNVEDDDDDDGVGDDDDDDDDDDEKEDRYVKFYVQSTAKCHIRTKQNVFLP